MIRKTKGKYFQNINKDKTAASKMYQNPVKPFITNKYVIVNEKVFIKAGVDEDVMITGINENVLINPLQAVLFFCTP